MFGVGRGAIRKFVCDVAVDGALLSVQDSGVLVVGRWCSSDMMRTTQFSSVVVSCMQSGWCGVPARELICFGVTSLEEGEPLHARHEAHFLSGAGGEWRHGRCSET